MPFPLLAAMAAMTAAKYISDRDKEQRDSKVRASEVRNSPWTHRQSFTPVDHANLGDTAMQGGSTYLAMDQNMENQDMAKRLSNAQIDALTSYSASKGQTPSSLSNWDNVRKRGGFSDENTYKMGPWYGRGA